MIRKNTHRHIQITHLGAKECVTGSCHLIQTRPDACDLLILESTYRDRNHTNRKDRVSAIIIAGSGMCTGGRIVDHLKYGLDDPKNDIFFVGYQAKGTPGRKIIEQQTPVKAGIHTLTGYSAHADQNTLVNWVRSMPEPPKQIHLVHGESHARHALSIKLGLKT